MMSDVLDGPPPTRRKRPSPSADNAAGTPGTADSTAAIAAANARGESFVRRFLLAVLAVLAVLATLATALLERHGLLHLLERHGPWMFAGFAAPILGYIISRELQPTIVFDMWRALLGLGLVSLLGICVSSLLAVVDGALETEDGGRRLHGWRGALTCFFANTCIVGASFVGGWILFYIAAANRIRAVNAASSATRSQGRR